VLPTHERHCTVLTRRSSMTLNVERWVCRSAMKVKCWQGFYTTARRELSRATWKAPRVETDSSACAAQLPLVSLTGNYVDHLWDLTCQSVFMCSVRSTQQTAISSLNTNQLILVMEMRCVFCDVGTGFLNIWISNSHEKQYQNFLPS
jgi:hypothetical protein